MLELPKSDELKAVELHKKSLVVDMSNSSMLPNEASEEEYVKNIQKSGVSAINMTIATNENFRQAIEKITKWNAFIEKFSRQLVLIRTSSDILDAKKRGKAGILFSFQNTAPVENDLNLLYVFKQLGVSVMQITYNERNLAGDGCSERTDCGLSDFGVEMIQEMNRLGIAIDLSHVGKATTKDVLKVTKAPVFCTHIGAYALNPSRRNKNDDELKDIAGTGGMVGVLSIGDFLRKSGDSSVAIDDFMDHVDHIVKTVGVEYVGFGLDLTENSKASDYPIHKKTVSSGWPWNYAKGLQSVNDIPNITRSLVFRKYSEENIEKILGGNFIKVFRDIVG